MRLIGITGGIGSGKSVVSRILRLKEIPVYDCDLEARKLMEGSCELREGILAVAGREAFREEGSLDRTLLGQKLFTDAVLRGEINRLVHSAVKNHLAHWAERFGDRPEQPVFVESAIIVSSGLAEMCELIWNVTAPEETRIERVVRRNGISMQQARDRISSQLEESRLLLGLARKGRRVVEIENSAGSRLLEVIERLLSALHTDKEEN